VNKQKLIDAQMRVLDDLEDQGLREQEQRSPKERVTTTSLKEWIDLIPTQPEPHAPLREWVTFIDAREKAWRKAFMWLHQGDGVGRCGDKYAEGVKLIEERLV
jgi:hypothetical protein